MPGTLIGEQKIEVRQVVRLYLMPFDLGSTHQSKVCSRPVITMNKGGDIFVLGVNGQEVVVPYQVLQQGTICLCSSLILGIMRKRMANTIIKWGVKITTKQKRMGLRNVCKAITKLLPHVLTLCE